MPPYSEHVVAPSEYEKELDVAIPEHTVVPKTSDLSTRRRRVRFASEEKNGVLFIEPASEFSEEERREMYGYGSAKDARIIRAGIALDLFIVMRGKNGNGVEVEADADADANVDSVLPQLQPQQHCLRGIEHMRSRQIFDLRRAKRRGIVRAVMREQRRGLWDVETTSTSTSRGDGDESENERKFRSLTLRMSLVSRMASLHDQKIALEAGAADAKEAE